MKIILRAFVGVLLALPLSLMAATPPAAPFTDAEIDALLAPVALYPDSVLSHVLIAATVPEDVEEAALWSRRHPDLKGQAAVDAVAGKDWDPSVKALVAFPDVLERMDEDMDWTEDLGEAFLEQEATVMDRVQYLRDRADEAGTLDDVEHVRVVREREYIYLEPEVERVVYVPYYDPWYVYGTWWWPYYPPHYWAYWGGYPAHHYHGAAFYWGVSFNLGPSYYYSRFNWADRHVVVSRPHRYYAPSPGYSGHSSMRRPRDSWHRESDRVVRNHSPWREDTRWRNTNTRRGTGNDRNVPSDRGNRPERTHRDNRRPREPLPSNGYDGGHDNRRPRESLPPQRRGWNRNAEQVRQQLGERRQARQPGRSGWAHERGKAARQPREVRRVDEGRSDSMPRAERRGWRSEGRDESRAEERRPQVERRGGGREESNRGFRPERPQGGREMSRGQGREERPRLHSRGRRDR